MRSIRWPMFLFVVAAFSRGASSQPNRIQYNDQRLYLSGANLAWVNFSSDIGPGNTDGARFADILLRMHDHGGNAVRWWLHTNGAVTPEFNAAGMVTGPGAGTIEDMRRVLDLAWEREIGVTLCLWSFDMMSASNSQTLLNRNAQLLTDTNYTRAYIDACLIPMIDSLKAHPAIIAWEIFNEPEGMSTEFGWSAVQHIPMAAIQRFINLCAGAIHRRDPKACVTSGAWAFYALTDVPSVILAKTGSHRSGMSGLDKHDVETRFAHKYRMQLSADEIFRHYERAASRPAYNYYRDDRLIASGGDSAGTLDFYSVHYYDWGGTMISPFHHDKGYWDLGKPLIVGEFALQPTFGVPKENLYDTLYQLGYAGALAWSWTDPGFSSAADMLASMTDMWTKHRSDVDVKGVGGEWPVVAITRPVSDTTFADTAQVTIEASASDADGSIMRVEFFVSDSVKIGEATAPPYAMIWKNTKPGVQGLTAVATDNQGHRRISHTVVITIGTPKWVRMEAEKAAVEGAGIAAKGDTTASGGAYLDAATQAGSVTWTIANVPSVGTYELAIGYKLFYASPKAQYINVNGARTDTLTFSASSASTWMEKTFTAALVPGDNTVQMELFWGWMHVDYLAVPSSLSVTPVVRSAEPPARFALLQNFPNPFNPSTTVTFTIAENSDVTVKVYDVIGREVATLVNSRLFAGKHSARFDGSSVASGVYLYRLTAVHGRSTFTETKRFLVMK